MIAAATRQDLQTALDRTKNSILGTVMSRNDIQVSVTQLRTSILQDLHEMHAENQQALRQSQAQRYQLMVRVNNLEHQMTATQQIMLRILDQQTRAMNILQR
jgi:hypothetical protein